MNKKILLKIRALLVLSVIGAVVAITLGFLRPPRLFYWAAGISLLLAILGFVLTLREINKEDKRRLLSQATQAKSKPDN